MGPVTSEGQLAFRDSLLAATVLTSCGVKGVYGMGSAFVAAFESVDRFVTEAGRGDQPEVYRFPAVFSREYLIRSDFLRSFPNLAGSIHGFDGGENEHAALLRDPHGLDWAAQLTPTDLDLPAACYPVYPMVTGQLPDGGRLFDVLGTCFRREPSDDPARMQAFHQHEFVHIGTPESSLAFRDDWVGRSQQMMADLGLEVVVDAANDPFFGRAGSILAASQREHALKFELLATVSSKERPTAIVSCNCHLDHLTAPFEISASGGSTAHSACVGFGIERIVLALFAEHGLEPDHWPNDTRKRLQL
ncbi:MAG: amino acid--[acyl-carrier-protein] ligase [Acidimicrobiia bacterium]